MSCDYNDAYILKDAYIFKDYITEINNTQVGNVKGKILVLWCQSII